MNIREIEQEILDIRRDVARLMKAHECETITVQQAAQMCGFTGKDTNKQVYRLIEASNGEIITNKPRPKMLRINKKSLQVFLAKNPQYNKIRIAA